MSATVPPALQPGARLAFRKTLTVAEQAMFTGISGNLAPLHVDAARARAAGAPDMLAFELVVGALVTTCLNRLAGPGHRIAALSLDFAAAVPVGASIEASAEFLGEADGALAFRVAASQDGAGAVMQGSATLVPVAF
ncbi:MaoC/PaaZ C-terminal domain-containing protein [Roseomonas sp. USHLN139]|uniref:MaoC/PaaZ C-terminal domain-containing protein n=1 Tax=Roseomonas sp. USHLN139 TaxID=3081298 RepID=UPI003B02501E